MRRLLAVAVFVFAQGLLFAGGQDVDLSYQFADPPRDQGATGACHTFAAVALLEAGYYRQYREPVIFSEADLFLAKTVLGKAYYRDFYRGNRDGVSLVAEDGDAPTEVQYALKNGIASGIDYTEFMNRYAAFRKNEEATLRRLLWSYDKNEPWLVKLLYDPARHWAKLQRRPEAVKILEKHLTGNADLTADRARTKERFKGFKLLTKDYKELGPERINSMSGEACFEKGAAQRKFLLMELDAGRPVLVGMEQAGLEVVNPNAGGSATHSLMITGYKTAQDGGILFTVRDSVPGNPGVKEKDMCRIYYASSLFTPSEAASK